MKRVLLSILVIVLVLGVIAAAGITGYRFGYAQGLQATANGQTPQLRPFDDVNPRGLPSRDFGLDREFHRGFGMRGFPMMGFGFFSPLRLLMPIVLLALIVWFAYWLFTRSGWRLTRTLQTMEASTPTTSTETIVEEKED